jgi:hypothetical protein
MTPTPNFIKMHKFDETLIGQAERQTEGWSHKPHFPF